MLIYFFISFFEQLNSLIVWYLLLLFLVYRAPRLEKVNETANLSILFFRAHGSPLLVSSKLPEPKQRKVKSLFSNKPVYSAEGNPG